MSRFKLCAAAVCLVSMCGAAVSSKATPKFKRLADLWHHPHAWGGLTQGIDGRLYSTTSGTGTIPGQIFKVTPSGELTTLQALRGQSHAGLVLATDGNFYGTTEFGGEYRACSIFRVSPEGTLTTLYSFCLQSGCFDGQMPVAPLIQATDGNLYGTTYAGGASSGGTIFRMTLAGQVTILYSFCSQPDCADGGGPMAPLLQASDGNFYGTTLGGGTARTYGTVYRFSPDGSYAVLHSFCSETNCTDGGEAQAGLMQASDGNLYGTTYGPGAAYRIDLDGTFQTLYTFLCNMPNCAHGGGPAGSLIQATDGKLYGTTEGGGMGHGTLFQMTLQGKLTTLHDFCSLPHCRDGALPMSPLFQATNGKLYGATYGTEGAEPGSVYELSVGLAPFVIPVPSYGAAGSSITILGNNLAGATAVSFHGRPAAFTTNSTGTAITATVPTSATTGPIRVKLADGTTLSSNATFRVTP